MDQKETIEKWNEFQEAKKSLIVNGFSEDEANSQACQTWNNWASQMINERKLLKDNELWQVENEGAINPIGINDETQSWLKRAKVDFSRVIFTRAEQDKNISPKIVNDSVKVKVDSQGEAINFNGLIFPGPTSFEQSVFDGWVWFRDAKFYGQANFKSVQFLTWVGFEDTEFHHLSWFNEVLFSDHGVFTGARFKKDTQFDLSEFNLGGNFTDTKFFGNTSFFAIASHRGFLVNNIFFENTPSFIQANFCEAPNISTKSIQKPKNSNFNWQPFSIEERYGALKKIATTTKDHNSEHYFFSKELRSIPWRRGSIIKKILGYFFWIISDYGRSILRPALCWVLNGIGFWLIYTNRALSIPTNTIVCKWSPELNYTPATYVSLINSIPFSQLFKMKKLQDALDCLGGSHDAFWPGLNFLLLMQNLIAVFLVFLFLLALRNHFRIR